MYSLKLLLSTYQVIINFMQKNIWKLATQLYFMALFHNVTQKNNILVLSTHPILHIADSPDENSVLAESAISTDHKYNFA